MSMNAVAIVKIVPETLRVALRPSGDDDLPDVIDRGNGLSFRITALEDAALILPTLSFDHEPEEIAEALKRCLGGVLSAHRDSRGVLVFPDKAMPSSKRYDAVVDEIGELGFWVSLTAKPKPRSEPKPQPAPQPVAAPAAAPSLAGLGETMQSLMSAIPPEALSQMQEAMASGDPSQMQQMEAQLQAMLGHEQLAALQESLLGAFGGGEMPTEMPGEDQMEALIAQAQAQMEALQKNNPALFESLQRQFGGGEAHEADDADEADAERPTPTGEKK